jgi:lactoylglutathione lyase
MDTVTAVFKNAWPYRKDKMALPVKDLNAALPFYETVMKFNVTERRENPIKAATLSRDEIQIGLAENGGDPEQDGCFFEVNDVAEALAEMKAAWPDGKLSALQVQKHGETNWKVFFVIAPDGLCYCVGERQP